MRLEMLLLNREKLNSYYGGGLHGKDSIHLTKKEIKEIDKETFKGLNKLVQLYLDDNQILRIEPNTFVDMSNLTILNLKGNKLKKLEVNIFRGLVNLEGLWLEQNQIEEIDSNAFKSLVKLKFLYLHDNQLKDIDRNCFAYFEPIGLITLYSNKFERRVVSYFNYRLLPSTWRVNESRTELKRVGGFKSDWTEFLEQFLVKTIDQGNNANRIQNKSQETTEDQLINHKNEKSANQNNQKPQGQEKSANNDDNNKPKVKKRNEEKKEIEISKREIDQESTNDREERKRKEALEKRNEELEKELLKSKKEEQRLKEELQNAKEYKRNSSRHDSFERYKKIKSLGCGSYGTVHLVFDQNIQQNKAMKMIEKSSDEYCEFSHLWNTNHQNILRYFDHFEHDMDEMVYVCVITEYCEGGDLQKKIRQAKNAGEKLSETDIFSWIYQATNGLRYLHSDLVKIVHRDIKPANILLTIDNVVKLGDLGVAKSLKSTVSKTFVGTLQYMSPEQYKSQEDTLPDYSFKTDVWSLGCVLYELIRLERAFVKNPTEQLPSFKDTGRFKEVLPLMLEKDANVRIDSSKLYSMLRNIFNVYEETF